MANLNNREQIGWYNEKDDLFFCNKCFSEMESINRDLYKQITKKDLEKIPILVINVEKSLVKAVRKK